MMNFSRRRFLGASLAAGAGLAAPTALAMPRAGHSPDELHEPVHFSSGPASGPRHLAAALAALAHHADRIEHRDLLAIADFSAPSGEPRLHFVDIASGKVKNSFLVAHGRGSDPANSGYLQQFSNRPGSNASSEGSFLTGDIYRGKHGRSRRLHGLDEQNSNAFNRAIVIHPANYVDSGMARSLGRVGRSQGCFAVEQSEIGDVLDLLGPGRLLFAAK